MVSLQATVDAIRVAVSSTTTCTPATSTTLSDLLLPKNSARDTTRPNKNAKIPVSRKTKGSDAAPARGSRKLAEKEHGDGLSSRERSILATEVINATLKALSEAIKTPPTVQRQAFSKEMVKSSTRSTLRRSNSQPLSPLEPRSLNRVSSSPSLSSRLSKTTSSVSSVSSGHRSVAECARVAFACLRSLQISKSESIELPPLQLENGMSVLIGRLVTLGLDDIALKELRIMKRRLGPQDVKPTFKKTELKSNGPSSEASLPTLAELLDFGQPDVDVLNLGLVITTQLQILRIMATSRKYRQVENALPILERHHGSSPISLLLIAARDPTQTAKAARQLQTFSELLRSLCPSISAVDDAVALESRLSVRPDVAIRLQNLAFHSRALWWRLAGHKGDPRKELLDPLTRCLSAYARRSQRHALETYRAASSIIEEVQAVLSEDYDVGQNSKAYMSIYRLLGTLAKEANLIHEAIDWTMKLQQCLDSDVDSDAKFCCVTARLVTLSLRASVDHEKLGEHLLALLEGLERPLKGDSSELDDLLDDVSSVRRAAITFLADSRPSQHGEAHILSNSVQQMCESLVCMCPRLNLRYLGKRPETDSASKDMVRYEQRRLFISKSGLHAIDSVLFLTKLLFGEGRSKWDSLDLLLQECLSLLDRIMPNPAPSDNSTTTSPSYYTRISNMYFTQYLNMRRDSNDSKDGQQIRALQRAIACIEDRPGDEKQAAHFSMKLERIAEAYGNAGRHQDLFNTLLIIRDEKITKGVLSEVATAMSVQPLRTAWKLNEETSMLSRTISTLIRVYLKHLSSTLRCSLQSSLVVDTWSEDERGAVLEIYLDMLATQSNPTKPAKDLTGYVLRMLTTIYEREQYPIRRLRVITRALSSESCRHGLLGDALQCEYSSAAQAECFDIKGSRDCGLQGHLVQLQTFATSLRELLQDTPKIDVLKQCLATWSSLRQQCENLQEFQNRLEDTPELLMHLHAIADYMQMKGLTANRVAIFRLIADLNELCDDSLSRKGLILSLTDLGYQWLQMGYSGKAGLVLDRAQSYCQLHDAPLQTLLHLHLCYSEYSLAIGNHGECEDHLLTAKKTFNGYMELISSSKSSPDLQQMNQKNELLAHAYLVYSMLSLERGSPQVALAYARHYVRFIRRAWTITEEQERRKSTQNEDYSHADAAKPAEDMSLMSMSTSTPMVVTPRQGTSGAAFWRLSPLLFRSLVHLSKIYAHHGNFQETLYYAEQAQKLVSSTGSEAHLAMASACLGEIWLKARALDKASEQLTKAKELCTDLARSREKAIIASQLGRVHGFLGDHEAEVTAYEDAEAILDAITNSDYISDIDCIQTPTDMLQESMALLSVSEKQTASVRKTTTKAKAKPKTTSKRKAPVCSKLPDDSGLSALVDFTQLSALKGRILRQKSRALAINKKYPEAFNFLLEAQNLFSTEMDSVAQGLALAKQMLTQSMEQMAGDPVYSVLQDSTISFPSVVGSLKNEKGSGERQSVARLSPQRRPAAAKSNSGQCRSKSPTSDSFIGQLCQAHEHLMEWHSIALLVAPLSIIHSFSALLNSTSILLSATGLGKGKLLTHPGIAGCFTEMSRNLAIRRERSAARVDERMHPKIDISTWPSWSSLSPPRTSFGSPHDPPRFQRDYVDILPKNWTAISVSLSDSRQELCITKLQAGQSPFVLRLPLGRHNSIDADEEIFDFDQGQSELREIVELANESAHDARGMTSREAKTAWWEGRDDLDERLRNLLENIERVWLGGFTGIFSQHSRRPELLARFQKSFHNILDKHLPSRQKTGKRGGSPRITLDSRILDLFIGLGDASNDNCDLSEPLTDLLYFVVDVLQFHGELNAYAEVDFDSIVVETHDALRSYHQAVRAVGQQEEGSHTILILDKALHGFPWESLPCMYGLAVSRLPSLGCLRERIISSQEDGATEAPERLYINQNNGAYILNPSGDLKNTQETFEESLHSLNNWEGIIKREPTEAEFKENLLSKDLFLYFGHGSGAQYVRSKEIKKLDKCAVTMLMGCSSGALTEVGEFESFGTPMNYIHAGSPALVATLWDVTDKDIDRFAKSTLEHWGLFEKTEGQGETAGRKKGKGKGRKKVEAEQLDIGKQKLSLVDAVARGRDACNLRYLNAAAVVVYGVPVYLK